MISTSMLMIGVAVLAAMAVLTILVALYTMFTPDEDMSVRLDTYLGGSAGVDESGMPINPLIAEKINEAINRQGFAERVQRDLAQANVPLTVPEYILVRVAIPLVLVLASILIWRTWLMIPVAIIVGYLLPLLWLSMRRKRRNRDFNEQLPETLTMVASSLRGGFSLLQSLVNSGKESPEPTKSELRRVNQEVQLGISLNDALDHLVQRMESDDLDLVVTAIKIHNRVGGNLTMILENISTTIRERTKLRREIRVITSMQRLSSYIIGGLPFALGLIIFSINPEYMGELFKPGWTLCIPIGAFISSIIGFILIRRIVDIKI